MFNLLPSNYILLSATFISTSIATWVSYILIFFLSQVLEKDCKGIKMRDDSGGDGMYQLDPDGGSLSNAFWAYCDMTSYSGGWTMCYTTDEYVKPRTEVTYDASFPYGTVGYRTNCNNISVSWLNNFLSLWIRITQYMCVWISKYYFIFSFLHDAHIGVSIYVIVC